MAGNALPADASAAFTVVAGQAFAVNGGASTQRSMVNGITATFDTVVVPDAGAFVLSGHNGVATDATVSWSNPSGDGRTWLLTFTGASMSAGSLADGVYDLTMVASQMHVGSAAGPAMAADQVFAFHRLYGDANGDRTVNNADNFKFKASYLKNAGDPAFQSAFDYNADGTINNADNFQFKRRYLVTLAY